MNTRQDMRFMNTINEKTKVSMPPLLGSSDGIKRRKRSCSIRQKPKLETKIAKESSKDTMFIPDNAASTVFLDEKVIIPLKDRLEAKFSVHPSISELPPEIGPSLEASSFVDYSAQQQILAIDKQLQRTIEQSEDAFKLSDTLLKKSENVLDSIQNSREKIRNMKTTQSLATMLAVIYFWFINLFIHISELFQHRK